MNTIRTQQRAEKQIDKLHGLAIGLSIAAFILFLSLSSFGQVTGEKVKSDTVTCKGITAKGLNCQSTWITNGYCRVHNPERVTCGANTAKGTPCKAIVTRSGDHCATHSKLSAKDLALFPNYKEADKKLGQDNRFSDSWCELASKVN